MFVFALNLATSQESYWLFEPDIVYFEMEASGNPLFNVLRQVQIDKRLLLEV
jgi:hypothetical protein